MSRMRIWMASPLFVLVNSAAPATAPLSAAMLHDSCLAHASEPQSPGALVCASYIQGYLDSARSGAELLAQPVGRPADSETWEERAARTRLGKGYLDALRKREHQYCVAASVSLSDIIEQLLEYLRTHPPRAQTTAAEALSRTLALHHSCEQLTR